GGRDVLSVLEAYHGWSVATDAISTSIADNPQALSTRPDWVHPVVAPNTYRGEARGADSTPFYLKSVDAHLARLAEQGRQVAALEAEGYFFSSSGGSPVSCRIGMAVLDVMEEERLWENAQNHLPVRPLAGVGHLHAADRRLPEHPQDQAADGYHSTQCRLLCRPCLE
nr:hypothetical protein [Tanacetum cinerariifolium]